MNARRVLLINPPGEPGTTANREGAAGLGNVYPYEGAFLYPPHALAAVAATLRETGWQPTVIDAVIEGLDVESLVARAVKERASVMGVFASYATLEADIVALGRLRRACPDAAIIAFGPAMRFVGDRVLEEGAASLVLQAEPERLLPAACQRLAGGETLPHRVGASDLGVEGYDAEGWLVDLDALPYPAWDLLPWRRYRFLSIMASRGCEDACAYCPYVAAQGHRFRPRSASSVVDELSWLVERYAPRRIVFRDPVFARDRERVLEICDRVRGHADMGAGSRFTWECESRPEHFDADLLREMKRAGCGWVKIGLETTDEDVLRRVHRLLPGETRDDYVTQAAEVVRACREGGLRCRVFALLGLPGEGEAGLADTLSQLRRMAPTALGVKALEHYPGARWEEEPAPVDQGQLQRRMAPFLALAADLERQAVPPRRGRLASLLGRLTGPRRR